MVHDANKQLLGVADIYPGACLTAYLHSLHNPCRHAPRQPVLAAWFMYIRMLTTQGRSTQTSEQNLSTVMSCPEL